MRTTEEYKNLSIKEFTKVAQRYDSDHAGIYEMCKDDYPLSLEELRGEEFEWLLDAGCGTAPMLSLLTQEYPGKHFVGLDLTPEMIRKAKEKNLPNTDAFFASVYKALKPGGCLLLRDNTDPGWMMWAWNAVLLPLCNLIGHGDVKAYQLHDVRQLCKNADFTIEKLEAQKGHRMHLVARKER